MTPREAYVRRMEDLMCYDTESMDAFKWLVVMHAWNSVYLVGRSRDQEFAMTSHRYRDEEFWDHGIVFC